MKYISALFAAAVLAMPATAQQHQQTHPGGSGHPTMHAPAMHAPRPAMHATRPHVAARPATTHRVAHPRATTHHVVHHAAVHHPVHHTIHAAARPVHRAPRADVVRLRRNVVAVHRFHAGPYRAPRGFRYRHWVFGQRLPAIYFAPAFWLGDFLTFDLFAPPVGYVWVRYGPDALLIDQYTGEIIQVQYGVFY